MGRAKASGSERERVQRKPLDPKGKERLGEMGRVESSGSIVYVRTSGRWYFLICSDRFQTSPISIEFCLIVSKQILSIDFVDSAQDQARL